MLHRVTNELAINPDMVSYCTWDRSSNVRTYLVITMADGMQHRLEHQPYALGGFDCFKIETALLEACNKRK